MLKEDLGVLTYLFNRIDLRISMENMVIIL